MKKRWLYALVILLSAVSPVRAQQYYDVDDPVMGLYEGTWSSPNGKGALRAQIRALGAGAYDGFVEFRKDNELVNLLKLTWSGKDSRGAAVFSGAPLRARGVPEFQPIRAELFVMNGKLDGKISGATQDGPVSARRIHRKSPTLGEKPPVGAIVVFDGEDHGVFREFNWKIVEGKAMEVGGNDLIAKEPLDSFKLHVEFRTPFMPLARGQGRGNSGVYLQSLYEVQVLDSFGLYPLQINDCGSIYSVFTAPGNQCLPPMEWQTYDITLTNGGKGEIPEITIEHNGVKTIQTKVPEAIVGKGGGGGTPGAGFLKLQNHGNPVQYRNIWVLPLK